MAWSPVSDMYPGALSALLFQASYEETSGARGFSVSTGDKLEEREDGVQGMLADRR
jgi:hypothetical protein